MIPDPFWRYRQFLSEAEHDRLGDQVPRQRRRVKLHLRTRLARALVAFATWLSPEIRQPAPALKLARATRRNGTV